VLRITGKSNVADGFGRYLISPYLSVAESIDGKQRCSNSVPRIDESDTACHTPWPPAGRRRREIGNGGTAEEREERRATLL
jgi:hypothetical protein